MTDHEEPTTEAGPVEIIGGALRGTYHAEFPKATEDDWRADAEFILARFQEYGWRLIPESEARTTPPAGLGRPERWVQTQWGPSEDHLHYLSHVSKWGPGLQDYGDGCRATITVENNDIDGGQFVRVIVHSIAQARATAPAGLDVALDDVMRNVVVGEWYDRPENTGPAVNRLHDAEAAMWRLYDFLGIDPGDSYRRPAALAADSEPVE